MHLLRLLRPIWNLLTIWFKFSKIIVAINYEIYMEIYGKHLTVLINSFIKHQVGI